MNRSSLIYDLMEPIRPSVDRRLYKFMAKTTLRVSDFFETRQGVCKVMPELASKIIPLVRSLDSDINRIVKEFAGNSKNRRIEASPDDYRKFEADGNDSLDTVEAVVQN
jgi:CRISPR/Cas system-associated endonuclease Cas1